MIKINEFDGDMENDIDILQEIDEICNRELSPFINSFMNDDMVMRFEYSKEICYQKITDFIFEHPETFDEFILILNMSNYQLQCLYNDTGLIHDVFMSRDSSGNLIRKDKIGPRESLYNFLRNVIHINMESTDLTPPSRYFSYY